MSRYLQDTLARKIVFFTGKGGVGKTSTAWATALAAKRAGKRVIVAAWDPLDLARIPAGNSLLSGIESLVLDTRTCFREYALLTVKFEKLYDIVFENHVLRTFIDTAPGISDTVIAGKLENLVETHEYDLVVVDLPSSGHTLSFFQSPLGIRKIFSVGSVHRDVVRILDLFQGPKARLDFVSIPEELSVTENAELKKKLSNVFPMSFGFLHMNQLIPPFDLPTAELLPASLRGCRRQYEEKGRLQAEAVISAATLELPMMKYFRSALPESLMVIDKLSLEMEKPVG